MSDQRLVIGEPVDEDDLRRNGEGEQVEHVDEPTIGSPKYGVLGKVWRAYRNHKKERKYADKNYVRWYLVGSGWPRPKYVKPEGKGGGIPEYKHNGTTYLFPERGRLPDRESGMFTYVHQVGEVDPVNLSDPRPYAIKGDELDEYLTKRVTSSPPGLLDKFDIDGETILYVSIALVLLFAVLQRFLGGGM